MPISRFLLALNLLKKSQKDGDSINIHSIETELLKKLSSQPHNKILNNPLNESEDNSYQETERIERIVKMLLKTIFPWIKENLFRDIKDDTIRSIKSRKIENNEISKNQKILKIATINIQNQISKDFRNNIINKCHIWYEKSDLILRNYFRVKMNLYFYPLVIKKLIKKNNLDIVNIFINAIEKIICESVKLTFTALILEISVVFRNISNSTENQNRFLSLLNLSIDLNKIFHDYFQNLSSNFYEENKSQLVLIAIKSLICC